MKTLYDHITKEPNDFQVDQSDRVVCPVCTHTKDVVEILMIDDELICSTCWLDQKREDEHRARQAAPPPLPWESEAGLYIKAERTRKLDTTRWTIMPDSPLTHQCQAKFLTYLKKLHRIRLDFTTPDDVVWPTVPDLEYDNA